jgi:DNA-binding transcriptional MerR regulator
MARITGVGRERLRTWERRHGFPMPVRTPNGTRRYFASDVRRVVAAARCVEAGMAVAEAIAQATSTPERIVEPTESLRMDAALDHCDAPVLALAGPAPLRVVWANRPTTASPEAPAVGDELDELTPLFGAVALARLQELMVEEGPRSVVVEHRDWTSTFPSERRSIAWRLPPEAADEPTVVLMQLPETATAAPVPQAPAGSSTTWAAALREARHVLQDERGIASVQRSLGALLRATGGLDGFLATQQAGRLRTATSVTGTLAARVCAVDSGSTLASALAGGRVCWLDEASAAAVGAPSRSRTLVVPLHAGGDRIGAAFLLFPAELELDGLVRELLHGYGTTLAATLQREHLAGARTGAE